MKCYSVSKLDYMIICLFLGTCKFSCPGKHQLCLILVIYMYIWYANITAVSVSDTDWKHFEEMCDSKQNCCLFLIPYFSMLSYSLRDCLY